MKLNTLIKALTIFFTFLFFGVSSQIGYLPVAPHLLLYTNPSFAGTNGGIRAQYCGTGIESRTPFTNDQHPRLFSADGYIKTLNGGAGISFFNYGGGSASLQLTAAPHLKLSRHSKLIPSLQGGILFDRYYSLGQAITISGGLLYQHKNFFAGAALSPLLINNPYQPWPVINIHSSYNFLISEKHIVHVFTKYGYSQNIYSLQAEVNLLFFKYLQAGGGIIDTRYLPAYYYSRSILSPYVNAGYRSSYFYVLLNLQSVSSYPGTAKLSWQWTIGLTSRPANKQKILVNFEEM